MHILENVSRHLPEMDLSAFIYLFVCLLQVHSANDWEHVDLGDEGRKSKFLRLMGAKKVHTMNHSTY